MFNQLSDRRVKCVVIFTDDKVIETSVEDEFFKNGQAFVLTKKIFFEFSKEWCRIDKTSLMFGRRKYSLSESEIVFRSSLHLRITSRMLSRSRATSILGFASFWRLIRNTWRIL